MRRSNEAYLGDGKLFKCEPTFIHDTEQIPPLPLAHLFDPVNRHGRVVPRTRKQKGTLQYGAAKVNMGAK